jgi:hypothetical protein
LEEKNLGVDELVVPVATRNAVDSDVFTYRIDVREKGQLGWGSLVRIRSRKQLTLAGESISPAKTPLETGVQVFPVKINAGLTTAYWKPGERTEFGCSSRIRNTLASDNSSLTFATRGELLNHWICVLSFEIDRDWAWDGLSETGIEIRPKKRFTGETATLEAETVGYVQLKKSASRLATTNPDRSYTRIVFVDAVEPKKNLDAPATHAHPFPNTIDLEYDVVPSFIAKHNRSKAFVRINKMGRKRSGRGGAFAE